MFEKFKSWLPLIGAFIIPLLAVYAWWGGFRSATVLPAERGPYVYAYLDHVGDLAKIPKTQNQVRAMLKAQGVTPGMPINVLLDDPRKVARAELRAQTGYLINAQTPIKAPLKRGEIAKRPVWLAQVQAAVLLAPSKAYQALADHLQTQQRDIQMPTVELYETAPDLWHVGVLSVEMAR